MEQALVWDIKDRGPVMAPSDDGTDEGYERAFRAMPVHLQMRWLRAVQTMDNMQKMILISRKREKMALKLR